MSDLTPGEVFAGFEITELVGRDDLSVVYLAIEGTLNRTVALRIMAPEVSQDTSFRDHFTHEAQMAASVDHPNVVTVFRFGEHEGQLFMAMRHVEARTLASILGDGPLSAERTASVISGVATALDAVHAAGLVHRNVRPINILLSTGENGTERVLLAGFGAAQPGTRTSLNAQGRLGGSVAYAAPELLQDRDTSPATDVYALACVLFACLAGQPPFPRPSHAEAIAAQLEAQPPAISAIRPDLPASLDLLFEYALAKDPAARYQSAGEFARALRPTLVPDRSATPTPLPAPLPSGVFTTRPSTVTAAPEPFGTPAAASVATHVPTPTPTPTPTRESAPVAASAEPDESSTPTLVPSPSPLPAEADRGRSRRPVVAVVAVFVLLVGALGLGLALSRQTGTTAKASLRLGQIFVGNNVRAERTWSIDGANGDRFTGVMTLTNLAGTDERIAVHETIPKEIATSAKAMTFDPAPFTVVEDDPVVRWCLTIAPRETKTITYGAPIPAGEVSAARLKPWADIWNKAIYQLDLTKGQLCDKTDLPPGQLVNQVTPDEQITDVAAGSVPPSAPDTVANPDSTDNPNSTSSSTVVGNTTSSTTRPNVTVAPTVIGNPTIPLPTTPPTVTPPAPPGAPVDVFVSNPRPNTDTGQPYCGGVPSSVTVNLAWKAPSSGGAVARYEIKVSRYAYTGGAPQVLNRDFQTENTSALNVDLSVPRSDPAQSYYVYVVTPFNATNVAGPGTTAKIIMPNVMNLCSWTMWQMFRTVGLPPAEDQTVVDPQGRDDNRIYHQTFAPGSIQTAGSLAPVKSYKSP